jgi:uncharacterized FlaG/YvyC family protein
MVFGPSHVGGPDPAFGRETQRARQSAAAAQTFELPTSIPATPPPEVLDALDTAARVIEELASRRLTLHFDYDEDRNHVRVQVTNHEGKVVREIPSSELLDIAAGIEVPRAA